MKINQIHFSIILTIICLQVFSQSSENTNLNIDQTDLLNSTARIQTKVTDPNSIVAISIHFDTKKEAKIHQEKLKQIGILEGYVLQIQGELRNGK